MAQELTFERKQQLTAGLLKGMGLLHVGRSLWVAAMVARDSLPLAAVILALHAGIAAVSWLLARGATRDPEWTLAGICVLLLALQFNSLTQLASPHLQSTGLMVMGILQILPNWIGLLCMGLLLGNPDGYWAAWSARLGAWKKWVPFVQGPMLILLVADLGLGQAGFEPGVLDPPSQVARVGGFRNLHSNWTDVHGINAVSPAARRCLEQYLSGAAQSYEWPTHFRDELEDLYNEHRAILGGELQTPFSRFMDSLQSLPATRLDVVDRAYLDLLHKPINADGFRSIPFRNDSTSKTKVLLLGDSFTWGHSARHLGNSFSDLLIMQGFAVYNSGISGTDPAQYEAVAARFVPVIQPDVVVVNLYLGNDIVYFDRPVVPFRSPCYHSNVGTLMAYPGPEWLPSPLDAYGFVRRESMIPATDSLPFNDFCSKSSLGTLAWKVWRGLGFIPFVRTNRDYWRRCSGSIHERPVTGDHLRRIQTICQQQGTRFVLAVIPQYPEDSDSLLQKYPEVFQGMQPVIPQGLTNEDYSASGGHYNDAGHRKHAQMLQRHLAQ